MNVDDVNVISVLGAGNMGHGIAEVAALAGFTVTLRDVTDEFVADGYEDIEWSLGKLTENGRISEEEADDALDRVTPFVDLEEAVADADVVIEAVPEKMAIKKEVYADLGAHAPDEAVFATNTSSLSITDLSEVTERPERFCGMHFFNPPVRMPLVEVIAGAHTDEATLSLVETLAERMGKTAVRVRKDSPGFVVNRVLVPLMNEAAWMVHDGDATVAEVDATTKFDMGLPMGTFELADQVGIDVGVDVLDYMYDVLGDAYEPCPLLTRKVEDEALGKKSGVGFYDYEDGAGAQIPSDATSEAVRERLLAVMANETAGLVADDVADPPDVDEAMKLGAAFPEGPAKLAGEASIAALVGTLDDLHERTGAARYAVVDALREMADSGAGFYGDREGRETGDDRAYEHLRVEREGSVVRVTLDREHRMNAITTDMVDELDDAIDRVDADDDARVLLLAAAGDRAFSVGADAQSTAGAVGNPIELSELSRRGQRVIGKLEEIGVPVVAAVDGYCLGGGMELVTGADLRIATERAEFGQTEFNLGLMPGWGGTQRLQRIVGMGRAKEIIFTADRFDAERMADFGFVNEVVPNGELDERATEWAEKLARGPPIAQRFTKRAMLRGWGDVEAGLEIENQAFGHLASTDDLMEGVSAFMSDRDPEFEGK